MVPGEWQSKKRKYFPPCTRVLCLSCSVVSDSVIPWTVAHQAPLSMDSPGKNIGVSSHFLLQDNFLTQGSNLDLLPYRQILYNHGGPSKSLQLSKKRHLCHI